MSPAGNRTRAVLSLAASLSRRRIPVRDSETIYLVRIPGMRRSPPATGSSMLSGDRTARQSRGHQRDVDRRADGSNHREVKDSLHNALHIRKVHLERQIAAGIITVFNGAAGLGGSTRVERIVNTGPLVNPSTDATTSAPPSRRAHHRNERIK